MFKLIWCKQVIQILKPLRRKGRTPEHLSDLSPLPYLAQMKIRVNLHDQSSSSQPVLAAWLEYDWGQALSTLECSTGDFRLALKKGRVSMGHIFAELFTLSFDFVSNKLGHSELRLDERFIVVRIQDNCTDYSISVFTSDPYPHILDGLEKIICDYLNYALNNHPRSIRPYLYRMVKSKLSPTKLNLGHILLSIYRFICLRLSRQTK